MSNKQTRSISHTKRSVHLSKHHLFIEFYQQHAWNCFHFMPITFRSFNTFEQPTLLHVVWYAGADPSLEDVTGKTPLKWAQLNDRCPASLVKLLGSV